MANQEPGVLADMVSQAGSDDEEESKSGIMNEQSFRSLGKHFKINFTEKDTANFDNSMWVTAQTAMRMDYSDDRLELLYAIFRSCTFNQIMEDLANKKDKDANKLVVDGINEKIKVFLNMQAQKIDLKMKQLDRQKKDKERSRRTLKKSIEDDGTQRDELEEETAKLKKVADSVKISELQTQIHKFMKETEEQIEEKKEELKSKQEKFKKQYKKK